MRFIVCGDRNCEDYNLVKEFIDEVREEFDIDTIVSGNAKGVDKLGERYANEHGINLVTFPAKWKDIKTKGANVKERWNKWKNKNEKYNANAGFQRNEEMIKYVSPKGGVIAIQPYGKTAGTNHTIKLAKENKLILKQYEPTPMSDDEFEYKF